MEAELYHHGILGQKWGVRRFQNSDGSLTSLGFKHRNIREFRLDANKLKSSAKDFISSTSNTLEGVKEGVKGKSFDDLKIDALDYMNRKGVLDIFDANADAPFKATRERERYQSSSGKDFIRALDNLNRYSESVYRNQHNKLSADADAFDKLKERYIDMDSKHGYKGLTNALLHDSNNALADKKLGMLSKDARDIERSEMGKRFADDLKDMSTNELSKFRYRTAKSESNPFLGKTKDYIYEKQYIEPHWEEAYRDIPGRIREGVQRYYKMPNVEYPKVNGMEGQWEKPFNWDSLRSEMGYKVDESSKTKMPDKVFYPFNDEGYYDVPKYTWEEPETKKPYQTFVGGKVEDVLVGSKDTKEYSDWKKSIEMPSDYSHLTSKYKPTIDLGKDWMNQLSHSDLSEDFLMHHGIMGMHWGERKYQNKDGSLTEEGRKHYGVGPAREFAKKVGATAKKASETISTAARKTFRPTEADMNEKLAKAYEKKRIQDKKNQLRELQGKNKRIKDMSSQEVWEEIQARNNQRTLERMRRDASALHKGTDFIAKTAGIATTPVRELAGFGLNLAKENVAYGINRAAKSAIDDAVIAASKKRRLENRTELEKLRDDSEINKLKFEENTRGLREQNEVQRMMNNAALGDIRTAHEAKKLRNEMDEFDSKMSLREMNNARERTKAERDAAVNFLERQVAMGSETASTYAAERLARMKKNSPGGGGGQNQNPNQQGKKSNKKKQGKYNN